MLLTAERIHDGFRFLPEGAVLEADNEGTITAIHYDLEPDQVLRHNGILCPGFVNAHCHLELAHLKDMIPEHTGLIPFLQKIPPYRAAFSDEQKKAARHAAYQELLLNGVVAVGDIANGTDTLDLRTLDRLHMHTFVECIGFTESHSLALYEQYAAVYQAFADQPANSSMLRQSLVPHTPYSVSKNFFHLIDKHRPHSLISVHNQECRAENEFYLRKQGGVRELLAGFGIDDGFFEPSGKTSLQTYTGWLSAHHTLLFVHNTFTEATDVAVAGSRFQRTHWCLCPNANQYIEHTLPDVPMLVREGAGLCIGTDSLASNKQLSVLAELQTLQAAFPQFGWEVLLRWGTYNGAEALQMQEQIGSFEPGKRPGIVNLVPDEGDPSFWWREIPGPGAITIQRIL